MDPSLLLLLLLLLLNSFSPSSFANSMDHDKPLFLATEGTPVLFPQIDQGQDMNYTSINYTGDSSRTLGNKDLADLLDINFTIDGYSVPPLDGTNPNDVAKRDHNDYSMKFVAYDLRLGKLQIDALDMSFTVQIQMFLQWQEWDNLTSMEKKENCTFLCDTQHVVEKCCDDLWVPKLKLPNVEFTRMDSILSSGSRRCVDERQDYSNFMFQNKVIDQQGIALVDDSTNSTPCISQRLWDLSFDVKRDANMNFRKFPFDVQELSVEIRNPYSSRTWLQLMPGSLQQNTHKLIQETPMDLEPLGWRVIDVIVSPLCDVKSWKSTFLELDLLLFHSLINASQVEDIKKHLLNNCPKLYSLSFDDSTIDSTNTSLYDSIEKHYYERMNYTKTAYINCSRKNGSKYSSSYTNFWIGLSNQSFNIVSLPCLVDVVQNLTTPGIKVTILVKRYTLYYVLKLIIPMIVCVCFAFTTVAIEVKDVANRLMVVVPAAIALTSLQATVGATDLPVVSYIVPSTWLMMLSYVIQLLICFESMLVYKLFKYNLGHDSLEAKDHFKCVQFRWTARHIDFLLMGMLFILYTITVSLCILIPVANVQKTDLLSNGISIWNANSTLV